MINARWTKPVLAASLTLLLAAELLLPAPAMRVPHIMPIAPEAASSGTTDQDSSPWVATILARPLFNADRRPLAPNAAPATATTLPRLSAIIITGSVRSAIFTDAGQTPQVVTEGGEIDGYKVDSIAPDGVKLAGPNGLVTLHPQFLSGASSSATASAAPSPPPAAPSPGTGKPARLDDDPI